MSDTTTQFDRYIRHGREAVETHPDRIDGDGDTIGNLDFETAAVDGISSMLHALDDEDGLTPAQARKRAGSMDGAGRGDRFEILCRAWRSYVGDFEDLEIEDDEHEPDPWNVYCDAERAAFEAAAKQLRGFTRPQLRMIRESADESGSDIADVCSMLLGDKATPEGWSV